MAGVALKDATIANSTSSGHITYRKWEQTGTTPTYCTSTDPDTGACTSWGGGDPIMEWVYYNTNATVTGKCNASSNGVYINGKNAVLNGDSTVEDDQYSIPSGEYVSGAHNGASGSVTSGNGRSVYIGGKSVSLNGSSVTTHAGTSTNINQGSSNVNIG